MREVTLEFKVVEDEKTGYCTFFVKLPLEDKEERDRYRAFTMESTSKNGDIETVKLAANEVIYMYQMAGEGYFILEAQYLKKMEHWGKQFMDSSMKENINLVRAFWLHFRARQISYEDLTQRYYEYKNRADLKLLLWKDRLYSLLDSSVSLEECALLSYKIEPDGEDFSCYFKLPVDNWMREVSRTWFSETGENGTKEEELFQEQSSAKLERAVMLEHIKEGDFPLYPKYHDIRTLIQKRIELLQSGGSSMEELLGLKSEGHLEQELDVMNLYQKVQQIPKETVLGFFNKETQDAEPFQVNLVVV